jgi:hypothetical protein
MHEAWEAYRFSTLAGQIFWSVVEGDKILK